MKKVFSIIGLSLTFLLIYLALTLAFSTTWLQVTFADISMDKIFFHLLMPLEGTERQLIFSFVRECLVTPLIISVAFIFVLGYWCKKRIYLTASLKKRTKSLLIFPPVFLQRKVVLAAIALLCLTCSLLYIDKVFDIRTYYKYFTTETVIYKEHYINPRNTPIHFPEHPNNLILVFLESVESTFQDTEAGGAFGENLIPELTQLARNNIHFSYSDKITGGEVISGWTMGATVTATAGVPLKPPPTGFAKDGNSLDTMKFILSRAHTLSDILAANGYNITHVQGTPSRFAGLNKYLLGHGYQKIIDPTSVSKTTNDYQLSDFGFFDKDIYELSKQEITRLSKTGKPFAVSINTMDTHFMDGVVCDKCGNSFKELYQNVYACASKQADEFVSWIKQQPFGQNTTIVLLGDHVTMNPDFFDRHTTIQDYHRVPYNVIINSRVQPYKDKNRKFSMLDWFPTIIESLGAEIDADGLALGRSLFRDIYTLTERMGFDSLINELQKQSPLYNSLYFTVDF